MVRIGLLGLGTVGGGTVNVLSKNAEEIRRRCGAELKIVKASARDLNRPRICNTSGIALTTDPLSIINDPEIDVVVELIGGDTLAKELVEQALANGKHVVTANKALIAHHGNALFQLAKEKQVMLAFEAAVAGGIPIIKSLREGLAGNQIEWLAGIINGTGNFILTEMRDKGRDFADVLAEAQELGYAEADPTFDVEGIDAAHKLSILAAIAFGMPIDFEHVFTEGITQITRMDVEYAEQLGYRIKHLGIARKTEKGIEMRVHPTLIPEKRLIANVNGVMNAVLVKGNAVGPTLYYGAGAGADATASAVVADLVDVARGIHDTNDARVPSLGFQDSALKPFDVLPVEQIETAYYLRLAAEDKPGVMAEVTRILANHDISIEAIVQKEPLDGESHIPVILLTQRVQEANMLNAIAEIEALSTIAKPVTRIRVESLQ